MRCEPLNGVGIHVLPLKDAQRATLVTFVRFHFSIVKLAFHAVYAHQLSVGSKGDVVQTAVETLVIGFGRRQSVGAQLLFYLPRGVVHQVKLWRSVVVGQYNRLAFARDGTLNFALNGQCNGLFRLHVHSLWHG